MMREELIRLIEEVRKMPESEWKQLKAEVLKFQEPKTVQLTKTEEDPIEVKIYEFMKEIGVPTNIKGYRCIRKAIKLSIDNPGLLENVTKGLYPAVAREMDTTSSRVERAMRHAVECTFEKGNYDKIYEVFGYSYSQQKGKPTNSEFISGIIVYLRYSK